VSKKKKKKRIKKKVEDRKEVLASRYPNGKLIYSFVKETKAKGSFKDYVLVTENRMIDYRDSYNIMIKNKTEVGRKYLVHKSKLKNLIGEALALKFWHPKFGRLVDVKEGKKKGE
jgi:hypothetical protein